MVEISSVCVRVCVCLLDDTAAGCWVIVGADFILVAVHVVDMRVAFPLVVHLSDGDQLNCLPLLQDPGVLGVLALVLSDQTFRGLRDGWLWEPKQWVDQVLVVLEQLLPAH